MATERQIAANRANARRSTGPRSGAGKTRASQNAYRHGLTAIALSSVECEKRIEKLARRIAGNLSDTVTLEMARTAARSEFDLERIRIIKVSLVERAKKMGKTSGSVFPLHGDRTVLAPVKVSARTSLELGRTNEEVRRALSELLKLDRYERHAAALRDRLLRTIIKRIKQSDNQ
jgi:hypothetical protein